MDRQIVGFGQDDEGYTVATLDCHHGRHFRHQPPWQIAEWAQDEQGRKSMLGATVDCPRCEWIDLPDGLVVQRTTDEWDETSVPVGLQRDHRVADGVWGRVRVIEGEVTFRFSDGGGGEAAPEGILRRGQHQLIPPRRPHRLELTGPVRLQVDFLVPSLPRGETQE